MQMPNLDFKRFTNTKGVTLTELMVVTVLFLIVSAGFYKGYKNLTQSALQTQQESKQNRKLQQFLTQFRFQVENTVSLPQAHRTALELIKRVECVVPGEEFEIMGWSLIPYPGINLETFNTDFSVLDVVNPLTMLPNGEDDPERRNDAIRLVYVAPDTSLHFLAIDETNSESIPLPYPTTGNLPIILSTAPTDLQIGDFAVVGDIQKTELIRVTNIIEDVNGLDGLFGVEYDSGLSTWNWNLSGSGFVGSFGHNVPGGGGYLYKVQVVTYALDEQNNTLMADDHIRDDGFDGEAFAGPPGLALNWQPVADGISQFQVIYDTIHGLTRTPQPGQPGKSYESCDAQGGVPPADSCDCENHLGYPGINEIKLEIRLAEQ